ncbi:hypothetical protein GCM10009551_008330 [Nocardiopsis tropica]
MTSTEHTERTVVATTAGRQEPTHHMTREPIRSPRALLSQGTAGGSVLPAPGRRPW